MNLNSGQNPQSKQEEAVEAATFDYLDSKLQLSDFSVIKDSLTADAIPNLHLNSQQQPLPSNVGNRQVRDHSSYPLVPRAPTVRKGGISTSVPATCSSTITSSSSTNSTKNSTGTATTTTTTTNNRNSTTITNHHGNLQPNPTTHAGTFLSYANQLQDPSRYHHPHQLLSSQSLGQQSLPMCNQQQQQQQQQSFHPAFQFWNLPINPQILANHQTALNLSSSSSQFLTNMVPMQNLELHSTANNGNNHHTSVSLVGNKRKVQDMSCRTSQQPQKSQIAQHLSNNNENGSVDVANGVERVGTAIVKNETDAINSGRLGSSGSTATVTCTTNNTIATNVATPTNIASSSLTTNNGRTFQSAFLPLSQSMSKHPNKSIRADNTHVPHTALQLKNHDKAIQSEKLTPEDRRRYERNLREQQRSQRINQQIKELRKVLQESQVPFRQNKYSILTSVVDYITQLQQRSSLLANEHLKLVNTIRQTSDIVNSGFTRGSDEVPNVGNDTEIFYVQGLDYKAVFEQCSFPVAVAALDGRFLAWNPKFLSLTGLSNHYLEKSTIFSLLAVSNRDEVFRALGTLLRSTIDGINRTELKSDAQQQEDCQHDQEKDASPPLLDDTYNHVDDSNTDGLSSNSNNNDKDKDNENEDPPKNHDKENIQMVRSLGYWTGPLCPPHENVSDSYTH